MQSLLWMSATRPKIHLFNQRCPIQSRLQSVLGVRPLDVERNNLKVSLFTLHIEASCFFLCAVAEENNSCLKLHSKLVKWLVRHFLHSFSFTVNEDDNDNDDDEGDACDYEQQSAPDHRHVELFLCEV